VIGEIDLYGVFVPPFLLLVIAAWALSAALRLALRVSGAYRLVWHRPLFDLALFVIVLAALTSLAQVEAG
jgi:hypothetical protein